MGGLRRAWAAQVAIEGRLTARAICPHREFPSIRQHSPNTKLRESGLWNVHVEDNFDAALLASRRSSFSLLTIFSNAKSSGHTSHILPRKPCAPACAAFFHA
jgi:hypothetical protein